MLSSAYTSASNIVNLNPTTRVKVEKINNFTCKSIEPQKLQMVDSHPKLISFNPKNEYYGHQLGVGNDKDQKSYSVSPIKQEKRSF